MIAGAVFIDLTVGGAGCSKPHPAVADLENLPDAVTVEVYVGAGFPNLWTAAELAKQAERLNVTVKGSPRSVPAWLQAIKHKGVFEW